MVASRSALVWRLAAFFVLAGLVFVLPFAAAAGQANATEEEDGSGSAEELAALGEGLQQQELESLLHWAIEHSDPAELERQAKAGARAGAGEDLARFAERVAEIRELTANQKSEADVMRETLELLNGCDKPEEDLAMKERALEVLDDLVSQIDLAIDFAKTFDGVSALVKCFESGESSLKEGAFQVFGTASSNNHAFHEEALSQHPALIETLVAAVRTSEDGAVTAKALYALSTILRGSVPARNTFYRLDGPGLLAALLSGSVQKRVQKKVLTLASDLSLLEREYDIASFSSQDFAASLRAVLDNQQADADMNEKTLVLIQSLLRKDPDATAAHFRTVGMRSSVTDLLKRLDGPTDYVAEITSLGKTVLGELDAASKEEL